VVLTKADINRRQQEVIDAVTSVLGISHEDAGRILRKYKWWVPMQPSKHTSKAHNSRRDFSWDGLINQEQTTNQGGWTMREH
jgi:hypothetical protein